MVIFKLLFLAIFCSFGSSALALSPVQCLHRECVAVVDAGSTGSRLHIYAFDRDANNNPISIEEQWSKKVSPGLASVDMTYDAIENYFSNLFAAAPIQNIPVKVYATAGMRLKSRAQQAEYFNLTTQWFAIHPEWFLTHLKTISGQDEGVFGWLAVNYQLGTLIQHKPYVSVMDMGGASVQIAVPLQHADTVDKNARVDLDLYGQHVSLFVQSFLGLGKSSVYAKFGDAASCFPIGYVLRDGSVGIGNVINCQKSLTNFINSEYEVANKVQPILLANPVNSWYSLSGVNYLLNSMAFAFNDTHYTNEELLQTTNQLICTQQWQKLQSLYHNNEYIQSNCFASAYFYALMVNGYGLEPQQEIHYLNNKESSDWTVGVVVRDVV